MRDGHPVTAVGDPCQAIYGWRGASVANLDEFPEHFPNADGSPARRYVLSVNRRCGSRILAAANQHAAELYEQHPGVIPLEAPPEAPEGAITVGLFETRSKEIEWVADAIVAAHKTPNRRWKDIGILMRTNVDLSAVHEALIARKVPVEVVGLGGLLALPEVVDVVATLQAVNDLTANAAMLRILTGPRYRIGHRDLALLANRVPLARRLRAIARPRTTWSRPSMLRSPAWTRPRSSRWPRPSTIPARPAGGTRRRRSSGSASCRPSCGSCARTRASRCSTWYAG